MLKTDEINNKFEVRNFLTSASRYNKLLSYARGLAILVDTKNSSTKSLQKAIDRYRVETDNLESQVSSMKKKYKNAIIRDPKTGYYIKTK